MKEKKIEEIQDRILALLPNSGEKWRFEDCCSELSRLVAAWLDKEDKYAHFYILKGDNVCGTKKSHDILVAETKDKTLYLLDPTVWQFFSQDESILIGVADSLDEAIKLSVEKYGGEWKISEELANATEQEKEEWFRIIKTNINEGIL